MGLSLAMQWVRGDSSEAIWVQCLEFDTGENTGDLAQ